MGRMYGKSGAKSRKTGELNPKNCPEKWTRMIEINPEDTVSTHLFDEKIRKPSSISLMELFNENYNS